ncbi:hypothetical protein EC991_006557 [Linnemannia zychae]|nr:hypothetical protein EC991_006557 [Linnemannia zychae]
MLSSMSGNASNCEFLGISKTEITAPNKLVNAGFLLTLPIISKPKIPSGMTIQQFHIDKAISTSPPFSLAAAETKRLLDIFLDNTPKPTPMIDLLPLEARIEKSEQLVSCNTLILQSPQNIAGSAKKMTNTSAKVSQINFTLLKKELKWLAEIDMSPTEKAHTRWLPTRMAEEFIQDSVKDSAKITEIVALGPVLDRETYRKTRITMDLVTNLVSEFGNDAIVVSVGRRLCPVQDHLLCSRTCSQNDGQSEKNLKQYLRMNTSKAQDAWDEWTPGPY